MLEKTRAQPSRPGAPEEIILRHPEAGDGLPLNRLIAASPPLDGNSVYCNLLQCTHFAGTCVAAEAGGELVGFTSAYLKPGDDRTLFIWQIVVARAARGRGLARRMLMELLRRPDCRRVNAIETSINPGNEASWKIFRDLAAVLGAGASEQPLFDRERHFGGEHPDETLLRIKSESGPFTTTIQTS